MGQPPQSSTGRLRDVQYDDEFSSRHGQELSEDTTTTATETGTTIVGVVADDAVVLAADQRASVGGRIITNKDVQKVDTVHPTAAMALSGTVGHLQHLVRTLTAESRLYADRRGDELSMKALSTLAGNVLRSTPFQVSPLLGGVDDTGAHLYQLDVGGGVMSDSYAAGGSGMPFAYGVLEAQYDPDGHLADARELAANAVHAASQRDTASGDGLTVATITEDGVDVAAVVEPSEVV